MADQTVCLIGSSACDVCAGLIKTGKFVRLRTYETTYANSCLYGTADDACIIKAFSKHGTGAEKPDKDDDRDDETHKGADSMKACAQYALRGSEGVVSVALEIFKRCPDSFQLESMEKPAHTLVRCFGSHERTAEILREIRKAI